MKKRRAQVWVETVIYTTIAFIMIGLVLSFVKPKIEEIQDKAILDKTMEMFKNIDEIISNIRGTSGNQRVIELGLEKGTLKIDGENDKIIFEMESMYKFSEPGENVNYGNVVAYTKNVGKKTIVILTEDYSMNYNITYQDKDRLKQIPRSQTPYKFFISNKGISNNKIIIDTEVV